MTEPSNKVPVGFRPWRSRDDAGKLPLDYATIRIWSPWQPEARDVAVASLTPDTNVRQLWWSGVEHDAG